MSLSPSQGLSLTTCSAGIAHNTKVLAEHTARPSSNTSSLLSVILPKLKHDQSEHKTLDVEPYFAHYHTLSPSNLPASQHSAGGLTFLVVAEKSLGQRIPFGFLATLEKKFFQAFEPSSTDFNTLPSYGCASFNSTMRSLMVELGGTDSGKDDALRTAQREIEGVREIMTENIERVLDRGERLDLLVDKTGRLGDTARDFRVRSRGLRRRMWWKNVKLMVLLVLVVVFLVYLFVGFGCGLPGKMTILMPGVWCADYIQHGGDVCGGSCKCYVQSMVLRRYFAAHVCRHGYGKRLG
jgi:vesicle-associated membrane protein 7